MPVTYGLRTDLSIQQKAVLEVVREQKASIKLKAYAGTGKTSTLMEIAKVIKGSAFLGAFNKGIADEFAEKLRNQRSYNVKGATLHSAGFGAWRMLEPRVGSPDSRKVIGLARKKVAWDRKLGTAIAEAVGYAKQACLGVEGQASFEDHAAWESIVAYYDITLPSGIRPARFIEMCIEVYQESLQLCPATIDFDDMLLAPLYYKAPFTKYDWVMVDEAQDTNTARRLICFAMMRTDSRMVFVGDPYQAIYGFAGADSNAMDLVEEGLKAAGHEVCELPLSVTYRCPRAVVDVAQTWVADLEAASNAPEGLVTLIDHDQMWEDKFNPQEDVLICRNTRPLVGVARRLRKAGIPCVVEGMSGKIMKDLAVKWGDDSTIDEFLDHLDRYCKTEVTKWTAKNDMEKVDYVQDKCQTMRMLAEDVGMTATTNDLLKHIEFVFGENQGANVLRLCTVHRSKGREWKRVFLIGRNRYMPSAYAKAAWEIGQEENLQYVAVTRAKHELVEVDVPFKKKDEMEWWEE